MRSNLKMLGLGLTASWLGASSLQPAHAEPIGKWWSGAGMGEIEHGYNRGDGTELMLSCSPDDLDRLRISIQINGREPINEFVVFSANGEDFEFHADGYGTIETQSRASTNNIYFLFDAIKKADRLKVWFAPVSIYEGKTRLAGRKHSENLARHSTTISLSGSAQALGAEICGG